MPLLPSLPSPPARQEHDSMGPVDLPAGAWWGAQTARALRAYDIAGRPFPWPVLAAMARVKGACARANADLGQLDPALAAAIAEAAARVGTGALRDQFPLDLLQTGSGTASHMNMNEVLANLASVALGGQVGSRHPVHPNDHVNRGQSSNDIVPTAIHLAGALALREELLPALAGLQAALEDKAAAWQDTLTSGRTHLMDAMPLRLGQQVGGWAAQVGQARRRVGRAIDALVEVALGGTAVGTGAGRHPELADRALALLVQQTGLPLRRAADPFEALSARDGVVEAMGQLQVVATSLFKIAQDLRLLASGPRTGLGELVLPALAPGSSMMPGKVNPVMCEALIQACIRVQGHGTVVQLAGMGGQLQLNANLPVLADALLDSVGLLARGARAFADRAVAGMQADTTRCEATVARNLSLATALVPALGYDAAAALAKRAHASGRGVREQAREEGLLDEETLDRLLAAELLVGG
ncbi:class II fumarate hydratase [Myxococcota bacterium]|nr:class II fumarate hydratase [Myxococcota bacterium]